MRISAVIPTLNEAATVGRTVAELAAAVPGITVLVVDDGSPDGTAGAVRSAAASLPSSSISVLDRTGRPRGLGLAYIDGFREAVTRNPDAVLQMDADGQHPAAAVPAMVAALVDADLVVASRYVTGGGTGEWAKSRRLVSRLGGAAARTMLRLPYADLTGGLKLWRADLLRAMDLNSVSSTGFVFQIEMTLRAHRMGARIVEVPFEFRPRKRGASKMSARIALEAARRMLGWAIRPPRVSPYSRPGS